MYFLFSVVNLCWCFPGRTGLEKGIAWKQFQSKQRQRAIELTSVQVKCIPATIINCKKPSLHIQCGTWMGLPWSWKRPRSLCLMLGFHHAVTRSLYTFVDCPLQGLRNVFYEDTTEWSFSLVVSKRFLLQSAINDIHLLRTRRRVKSSFFVPSCVICVFKSCSPFPPSVF